MNMQRLAVRANWLIRQARDLLFASFAVIFLAITFLLPQRAVVWTNGFLARLVGMRIPRLYKIGMYNLSLAFPEKPETERREILRRSWDNMGRTAAEYFFIGSICDIEPATGKFLRLEGEGDETLARLANRNKPAILLSAHLANWELPMIVAARLGVVSTALFARPRNRWIARMVIARRNSAMGELVMAGPGALQRLARALEAGTHVGLLVDQFYPGGPKITLFGHPTEANPIFARLARLYECPVHMVHVIRLPGDRFRIDLGEELLLPRDASGRIDIQGSAQMVGTIIEGWVREHPDQWLWVARRWR